MAARRPPTHLPHSPHLTPVHARTPTPWRQAFAGWEDAARALLKRHASIELFMDTGETPLYVASMRGHIEMVRLLLAAGAAVDPPTNTGFTALYIAASKGHAAIASALLEHGADPVAALRVVAERGGTGAELVLQLATDIRYGYAGGLHLYSSGLGLLARALANGQWGVAVLLLRGIYGTSDSVLALLIAAWAAYGAAMGKFPCQRRAARRGRIGAFAVGLKRGL